MHSIKEYIRKIVDDGDRQEMGQLSDMLDNVVEDIYNYDENLGKKYEMCLYEMAYGKKLTDNMKRRWVEEMRPSYKWSEQEINQIINDFGVDIPISSAYVIMNMLYSDLKKAFGEGDDEESLRRYVQATKDWYYDSDATNTEEAKLYQYWKNIVN